MEEVVQVPAAAAVVVAETDKKSVSLRSRTRIMGMEVISTVTKRLMEYPCKSLVSFKVSMVRK